MAAWIYRGWMPGQDGDGSSAGVYGAAVCSCIDPERKPTNNAYSGAGELKCERLCESDAVRRCTSRTYNPDAGNVGGGRGAGTIEARRSARNLPEKRRIRRCIVWHESGCHDVRYAQCMKRTRNLQYNRYCNALQCGGAGEEKMRYNTQ
jgi:hypothetical protein